MSINDKLKACPCCGSKAEVNWGRPDLRECIAYVKCLDCGLHTRNCYGKTDRKAADDAVAAWNTRSTGVQLTLWEEM